MIPTVSKRLNYIGPNLLVIKDSLPVQQRRIINNHRETNKLNSLMNILNARLSIRLSLFLYFYSKDTHVAILVQLNPYYQFIPITLSVKYQSHDHLNTNHSISSIPITPSVK